MPPTTFQRKMLWVAITGLSFVALGATITLLGWLLIRGISYLQPILIPIAVAAILAYLVDPVVNWMEKQRLSRTLAIVIVFLAFLGLGAGIVLWIAPSAIHQGESFTRNFPAYSQRVQDLVGKTMSEARRLSEVLKKPEDPSAPTDPLSLYVTEAVNSGVASLQQQLPNLAASTGTLLQKSVGGFLGVFGFLLSLVLVPIFLFFFLREGPAIAANWSRYLPLRASPLKSEIVSLFTEINNYLINFFRGQLIVSLIDGAIIGICLLFVGLDFALLIGLLVGVLGLIPYLGMMICWIPAVLIAAAQFGDWWHPLLVTIIFVAANNIDGMIIAPKIVGESVGLHPLTVIISVLAWSLILGGLLGALLAVPLTATLKVVLKRYFWDRPGEGGPARET